MLDDLWAMYVKDWSYVSNYLNVEYYTMMLPDGLFQIELEETQTTLRMFAEVDILDTNQT